MAPHREDVNQVTRAIGRYERWTVHLAVRAEPSLDAGAPEEFAVTLFLASPEGRSVDVARIDTGHDGVHFDRLYLPLDDSLRRDYSVDIVDYRRAQRRLTRHWRDHVETYAGNHALPDAETRD